MNVATLAGALGPSQRGIADISDYFDGFRGSVRLLRVVCNGRLTDADDARRELRTLAGDDTPPRTPRTPTAHRVERGVRPR